MSDQPMPDPQQHQDPAAALPLPPPAGMPYAPSVLPEQYQVGPVLPAGVMLATKGRRVGAFFLGILLFIVTLGIGWLIWGLVVWGKGTSPALQVLGMRAWSTRDDKPASWGTMALRNIVGGIVQGLVGLATDLISFVMFLVDDQNRTIPDRIGGTIIVHDPNKVLG